ncbi:hypothetical protein WUBG_18270, partial [Wuchereria bancrofti]
VLVHVSTAYANCDKSEILEIVYPPPVPPNKLFEAIDWMDDVGPLFDRLRRSNPGIFSKLIPMGGDIMEEGLGLNQLDMQTICDEVSIVFHCAATVKFDEALRISVEMNVLGTQRLVALCHMIKNLL